MKRTRRDGAVLIGEIARRYSIHPQTLRMYEREGLIQPDRTEGNTRLYGVETIERLEIVLTLTRDLGVNLAGVEVILNMKERLENLQQHTGRLLDLLKSEAAKDRRPHDERYALVRLPSREVTKR
jgi:MerR family transcriptional regulator/heat shock protein HspR